MVVSSVRSGVLAAWTRAWIAGRVSLDQVIDATTGDDAPHLVTGLDAGPDVGTDRDADPVCATLRELLVAWRRGGTLPRLVLPVPGDVRGLPGPAALRTSALEAGEAAVADGLAVTPEITWFAPSSAPPTVTWWAVAADPVPPDQLTVRDAQYELTTAMRESASALTSAEVSGSRTDVAALLGGARRAGEQVNLPPGHSAAAVALLSQAERLHAVLELVADDPLGGAVDQYGMAARSAALRPLATAVRRARTAAYNADAADAP